MTNDRPTPDSELLSACFDGEVTAAERARVERLRTTSPAVEAELDSYAELSRSLRSLPRPSAPPEILLAVMQVAERSSLLAAGPSKPLRRSLLREGVIAAVASAVTAATVLVSVNAQRQSSMSPEAGWATTSHSDFPVVNFWSDNDDAAPRFGVQRSPARHDVDQLSNEELSVGVADRDGLARLPALDAKDASRPELAASLMELRSRVVPSTAAGRMVLDDKFAEAEKLNAEAPVAELADRVELRQVLPYVVANDGVVANVDLYFANPERGANEVQALLTRNGVQLMPSEPESKDQAPQLAESVVKRVDLKSERFAVYVDAPLQPVCDTLEQLAQRRELLGVQLQPPLLLPLQESERRTEAADARGEQFFDAVQLNVAYSEYLAANDNITDRDLAESENLPVDALFAENGDNLNEQREQEQARRLLREKMVQGIVGNSKFRYATPTAGGPQQEPISPLGTQPQEANVPMRSYNQLLKLPAANSFSRQSGASSNYNYNTTTNLAASDAPTPASGKALGEEALLRRKLGNTPAGNNVRLLFVFQESAAPTTMAAPISEPAAKPAGPPVPAAPAKK
jgi:hypothetical protein